MNTATDTSRPPDSHYARAREWMGKMHSYPRPQAARIPPNGTYWLRCATPTHHKFTTDHPQGQWSTCSWIRHELGEWFIASIEGSYYEVLRSDETTEWANNFSVVVEVGPEILPPRA